MENNPITLDSIFHALADPTRRAVIQQLTKGSASVTELAEPFDMALPSFMKHIRVLEDSRLISSSKAGRVRTCRIRPKPLHAAENWINDQTTLWEGRMERLADYIEKFTAEGKSK